MARLRLSARKKKDAGVWAGLGYLLGRALQVTGLVVTLVAATAFFGTPDTIAMLRMMLIGVLLFLPGWWLVRSTQPPRD
jgi:hypothetical protein